MIKRVFLGFGICLLALVIWQYLPPGDLPVLPANLDRAVWVGIEWVMEAYSDDEITALAAELRAHRVTDAFIYVSYLKSEGMFNPTYDHAAEFIRRMKAAAPEIRLLAWIGVPITITTSDEITIANRLDDPTVRQQIAVFSASMVDDLGFDGVHLNIEIVPDHDPAFLDTLRMVRAALPDGAWLSTTANPLLMMENTTAFPAFILRRNKHWSPEYLREVAQLSDQVAMMAYDSGLFFPRDYRTWMSYQVRTSVAALENLNVQFLIGLPVSEEWTASHHVYAESLANALAGFHEAGTFEAIDGIALYPYWEMDETEWSLLDAGTVSLKK